MITYSESKIDVPKHFMSHHTSLKKTHTYAKKTLSQQQQQKQPVELTPKGQSLAIAPILPLCVGRMGILLCLPNFCLFCIFIFCFIICAFACVKELLCLHHHLHHI